ncbi:MULTISPECIES: D-alanyl-D-alanine carboxypeptidase family protein [unclassified Streptomyces]|uniref:D-alanyl-D-alanine carboxypeptidase n=1 Tax=Streptomyces sp. NBC_00119 TaxID=2975659 RepID=A0AAU1UHH9_9ACTN|nr:MULTISPECIES: D-alanyl-D-alanine carboxypeptidase [unclassified Streptomyces]MCX4647907.1 D-alanyl-D-alanine carboxypeptidase [Streptomyces sp. NBC_01446]MCX5320486.1 D-alanyl-D-alanine carboxypeptidase [Streptomyces sp. NBC_00120]
MARFVGFYPCITKSVVASFAGAAIAVGPVGGVAAAVPRSDGVSNEIQTAPGTPDAPEVSALSWTVTDVGTGKLLGAKEPHLRLAPASTLKTLFALALLPQLPATTEHTAVTADIDDVAPGSSLVGVHEGTSYTVGDLWRGVFLSSGNDAVHTLARLNGGMDRTLARMQATADRLGAHDTSVRSADGFDTPGQYSSAYDLSLFAKAGLQNPDFRRYCGTKSAQFPAAGGPDSFGIQNTNRLLVGSHGVEPYPGLIGVKNGYTSEAGNTLVAAATRHNRTILITIMNPQDNAANAVYEESRELLDWGFDAAPQAVAAGQLRGSAPPTAPRHSEAAHHGAGAAQASTSGNGSSGLARHLEAAVALLSLACVPFILKAVRRRRRRSTR